jgi:hypothetical protein
MSEKLCRNQTWLKKGDIFIFPPMFNMLGTNQGEVYTAHQ